MTPNIRRLLYLLIVVSSFTSLSSSKLYLAKLIIVSEAPQIHLKTKFKFTDVMLSHKTSSTIKNSTLTQIDKVPTVDIKNNGRMESNYLKLQHGDGLYLNTDLMDIQQFQDYFGNKKQTRHFHFYILEQNVKEMLGNTSLNLCFLQANLTTLSKSAKQLKVAIKQCFEQLPILTEKQTIVSDQQLEPQLAQINLSELLIGCIVLAAFSCSKLLLIRRATKKESVV